MDNILLCSSGKSTTIWSINSDIIPTRQIPIAINSSKSIDWNHTSMDKICILSLDYYVFLCSDNGTMYLQNIAKDTCITFQNVVDDEDPSILVLTIFYFCSSSDFVWNYSYRKSLCHYRRCKRKHSSIQFSQS